MSATTTTQEWCSNTRKQKKNLVQKDKDEEEKRKDERVMRDIVLYKEYKQLIENGTSEDFIKNSANTHSVLYEQTSQRPPNPSFPTMSFTPNGSTNTPAVRNVHNSWRKIHPYKWIGVTQEWNDAHANSAAETQKMECEAEAEAESYDNLDTDNLDTDEDEDCEKFASDDSYANIEEAAANDSNKKIFCPQFPQKLFYYKSCNCACPKNLWKHMVNVVALHVAKNKVIWNVAVPQVAPKKYYTV
jgi:hypothetical protein